MIDIKFLRENPDAVKENIKKKFQDSKLPLVDEVIGLDLERRKTLQRAEALRADKNRISKEIGKFMANGQKDDAEKAKAQVAEFAKELAELEKQEPIIDEKINKIMMTIPNIIDPSVPIGKDDSENVEIKRYGEPAVPDFEVPYHSEIMEKLNGIDLDSARNLVCARLYDRQRFHLLCSSVYDPLQRRYGRYELCGNGRYDVQDRGRGLVSNRYFRALYDWQIHRHYYR